MLDGPAAERRYPRQPDPRVRASGRGGQRPHRAADDTTAAGDAVPLPLPPGRRHDSTGTFATAPRATRGVARPVRITGDADATPGRTASRASTASRRTRAMTRARKRLQRQLRRHHLLGLRARGRRVARTVTEKWAKYRLGLALAPLRQLRASAGLYSGWDDHEFVNDYSRAEHGVAIYRAGVSAFLDYTPSTYRPATRGLPQLPLGQESRALLPRRPQLPEREGDRRVRRRHRADRAGGGAPGVRHALARRSRSRCLRRAWTRSPRPADTARRGAARAFTRAIRGSTATFKVVVNPVPLMQLYALPYDRWEGYAAERSRVLDGFAGVRNVVVLTTDIHAHVIGEIRTQTFAPGRPRRDGHLGGRHRAGRDEHVREGDRLVPRRARLRRGRDGRVLQAGAAPRPRARVRPDGRRTATRRSPSRRRG